ncbi:MAG: orotate phosphoribosyltransferase [Nanoarchaeota archaeon]
MNIDKEEIARTLLNACAVTLRPTKPFIYASGIKSPIYTDNRVLISSVSDRKKIISAFCEVIRSNWMPDVIAGVATAGIPWAAWVSAELNLPMIFVRASAKDHGKNNQIEGTLFKGNKVVVIEDLVSSGGSTLGVVQAIRDSGATVDGCVAIFTYGLKKSVDTFKSAKVELITLTDLKILLDVALQDNSLDKKQAKMVLEWAEDPEMWGAK